MKTSIFFSHLLQISNDTGLSVIKTLKKAYKLGYKGIDLDYNLISEYKSDILKSKLKVVSVYAFIDFSEPNYTQTVVNVLDSIKGVNCSCLMVVPVKNENSDDGFNDAVLGLKKTVELAKNVGVTITVEPFDFENSYTNSFENLKTLLTTIDGLKLTFDTGNFLYDGTSIELAYSQFKDKIHRVHLKDRVTSFLTDGDKGFTMQSGTVYYCCPALEGELNLKSFLLGLKSDGYDEFVTVEHFGAINQFDYVKRSIKNLIKFYRKNPMQPKKQLHNLKNGYNAQELSVLDEFFKDFNIHCLISKTEKRKMILDLENAFKYYKSIGVSTSDACERLSNFNLGGFYAKTSNAWFPLDDAAKIYPTSLGHGVMSLFRLSVYLKKPVVPELLQIALTFTIKRFPSFATTIKKGVFWHYLDSTKIRFSVEKEVDAPVRPIPVSHSASQSFRVLYYENRISVEFFHVLTDGSGGIAFIKTLTHEYLKLLGVKVVNDGSVLDANDTPKASEIVNEFEKVTPSKQNSGLINKPSVQLSGKLTKLPCRFVHFKMNTNSLKEVAKNRGAKVTAYILALMFKASRAAIETYEGDVTIQLPVNMRNFYPSETLRNFSMYCGIRIPINKDYSFSELISEISRQLEEKTSKEVMSEMITSTQKLINSIRLIPLIIKLPVAKIMYGAVGDNAFTNTLSNLGVVKFPDSYSNEIESMDFILGTSDKNRVSSGLISVNGVTTLTVTKKTVDPSYEETLYNILLSEGVDFTVEGSDVYES